jgi:hypothetical protein
MCGFANRPPMESDGVKLVNMGGPLFVDATDSPLRVERLTLDGNVALRSGGQEIQQSIPGLFASISLQQGSKSVCICILRFFFLRSVNF